MMMTTLATILFSAMMLTALLSLTWDLTRQVLSDEGDSAWTKARLEAARIAALPRSRQPLRVIGGLAQPLAAPALTIPALAAAPIRRPAPPVFAAAA